MRGRIIIGMLLVALLPSKSMAQDDDLYFTPKDEPVEEPAVESVPMAVEPPTYYIGSNRDVDEYNRQGRYWQHYQKIGTDSLGNDIIEFSEGRGVYPDSLQIAETYVEDDSFDQEDFQYTRLFCRWNGFYDPWFYSGTMAIGVGMAVGTIHGIMAIGVGIVLGMVAVGIDPFMHTIVITLGGVEKEIVL